VHHFHNSNPAPINDTFLDVERMTEAIILSPDIKLLEFFLNMKFIFQIYPGLAMGDQKVSIPII